MVIWTYGRNFTSDGWLFYDSHLSGFKKQTKHLRMELDRLLHTVKMCSLCSIVWKYGGITPVWSVLVPGCLSCRVFRAKDSCYFDCLKLIFTIHFLKCLSPEIVFLFCSALPCWEGRRERMKCFSPVICVFISGLSCFPHCHYKGNLCFTCWMF